MSTLQNKIQQLRQASSPSGPISIGQVSGSLNSLTKISDNEIRSNQTYLRQSIDRIIPNMIESVSAQIPRAQSQTLSTAFRALKSFRQKYSNLIRAPARKQLNALAEQTFFELQKKRSQRLQSIVDNEYRKLGARKQLRNNGLVSQLSFEVYDPSKMKGESDTIQDQISPIRPFITKAPISLGTTDKIPQSVKLLNQYAVSQGYLPMGTTTQSQGRGYIGRYILKDGNTEHVLPFPKNTIMSGQTPNLINNYQYFAGKTMNAWNGFVEAENKFVEYSQKISTKQSRKQFVQAQIAGMNEATFSTQALATLTYYYVFIPLQNFVKYNLGEYDGTKASFLEKYTVGESISKNPLLLDTNRGKTLFNVLVTTSEPILLFNRMKTLISQYMNPANKQKIAQFSNYVIVKASQARTYFMNLGLSKPQIDKALGNQFIVGVKFKKFILPTPFSNTQIVEIIEKVTKKQSPKTIDWQLIWGSNKIMCHDYIWDYNL